MLVSSIEAAIIVRRAFLLPIVQVHDFGRSSYQTCWNE